jgi:DNA polymerase III epsilon subunit-like protein
MEFMQEIINADIELVVGHNVQFDRKIIIAELLKLKKLFPPQELTKYLEFMMNNNKFACTMVDTTEICNIPLEIKYKDKKTGEDKTFFKIKSPKLSESYFHYFGYEPDGEALHDALVDVILCLRVFMKYKYNTDICGKNEIITYYIIKISPQGYICPLDITEEMNEKVLENIDTNPNTELLTIYLNDNKKEKSGDSTKRKKRTGRKSKKNSKTKRSK